MKRDPLPEPDGIDLSSYDPDPWLLLLGERSCPIDAEVKRALADNHRSGSRRFLYPWVRALALGLILLFGGLRLLLPWRRLRSYAALHRLIVWSLRLFARPTASWIILRHFHIGSQILAFLADNLAPGRLSRPGQAPRALADLLPMAFMEHDLQLYRFIEELNRCSDTAAITARPPALLDCGALRPPELAPPVARRWHQFLDLQSAVELIVPLYVIFLPLDETRRASQSLQLDETVADYAARLLGAQDRLIWVHNKMPWVPLSLFGTAGRLLMHGVGAELMHGFLLLHQQQLRPGEWRT